MAALLLSLFDYHHWRRTGRCRSCSVTIGPADHRVDRQRDPLGRDPHLDRRFDPAFGDWPSWLL
ncbi:MAG: hypothetical protein M0C28_44430 [Candidatus Moduliflexus flocculans]|nr:hypothetical protein [Candidatus Moduliflexus flocculans]